MPFGIDTFSCHLDLLNYTDFQTWNGATQVNGKPVGGMPLFAGRNFLGGDFIWGHSEATNASSEPLTVGANKRAHYPLPPGDPSPEHPENLHLLVERIAPIQAPFKERQKLTGPKGLLYGRIDADALCKRLKATLLTGEFSFSGSNVFVWLGVDPNADFSADYWAGWADTVNNATLPIRSQGILLAQVQIFRACILCSYTASPDGMLRPDPHVTAALARSYRGLNTTIHARWADFKVWENAPADLLVNGDPLLDWNRFDKPTAPLLWRFARGFLLPPGTPGNLKPNGAPGNIDFGVDEVNPASASNDFWLETQAWQPNVPSIQNVGFSSSAAITASQASCLQNTNLPDMNDNNFHPNSGHFHVPGGEVKVIGRYIRHSATLSMGALEASRISNAGLRLFTIWESVRHLTGMGASEPSFDDKNPVDAWGPFNTNFHKNIFYFNPDPDGNPATHDDAGTQDAKEAFQYCATILKQPPQTPVFFAIDFDPYDLPDPHHPPHPAGTPQPSPPPGWPALPSVSERERWIKTYFENIKAARDDFAAQTGRYYLIGVYGVGQVLQLLYEQGIATFFWQAASSGRSGSRPPHWPWYHVNRWQYQSNRPVFCTIGRIDPDDDWGDGGDWSLADQLTQELINLETLEFLRILDDPSLILADLEPTSVEETA